MRTTDEFVFFWGNQDIYSNFYPETFVHDGIRFDAQDDCDPTVSVVIVGCTSHANQWRVSAGKSTGS